MTVTLSSTRCSVAQHPDASILFDRHVTEGSSKVTVPDYLPSQLVVLSSKVSVVKANVWNPTKSVSLWHNLTTALRYAGS